MNSERSPTSAYIPTEKCRSRGPAYAAEWKRPKLEGFKTEVVWVTESMMGVIRIQA